MAMRLLPALAFAAALAACHYEPKVEENALPRPEEYKEYFEDYVRNERTDPTGIRDASISTPALRTVAPNTVRYVICVKYTAKDNSDTRRYDQPKALAAIFYDRRVTQYTGATPELCGQAVYQPFPELQRLCREKICPR
jgi:hypothetical protein